MRTVSAAKALAKMHQLEADEQKALFAFLRTFAHLAPEFDVVHASLNGIYLPLATLKTDAEAQGMTAGVWDVCVPLARLHKPNSTFRDFQSQVQHDGPVLFTMLYIEMKTATGRLEDSQKDFQQNVHLNGFRYTLPCPMDSDAQPRSLLVRPDFVVCRSWIEAARTIVDYLQVTEKAILEAVN